LENNDLPIERFAALDQLGCRHGFVRRIPGIEVSHNKAEALDNLDAAHTRAREVIGMGEHAFASARQVHGNRIAVIDAPLASDRCFENCDGLITNQRKVCLGIYVADCCAIYLVDRRQRAVGLVHSGGKGTELAVVSAAITAMRTAFDVHPSDLIVQLSPCIRPPHYEVDFVTEIARQCGTAGVEAVHDSGVCTACNLSAYYSYRAEKGRTGRMLALLAL
jgi:copper oxidase (laccase) domain-containing protein